MVVVIIVVVTNLVVIIGRAARADSAAPSVSHPISRTKNQKKKRKNRIEKNGIEYGTKKIEYLGVLYFSPICIVVGRNENAEYFIPIRSGYPTLYSILWPFDEPVKRSKSDGPTGGPLLYIYYCISPVE